MERRKTYGQAHNGIGGEEDAARVETEHEGEIEDRRRSEGGEGVFSVQVVVDCRAGEVHRCFCAVRWHWGKSVE